MAVQGERRRPAEERREELLDAAEAVLLERGLAATTIADVALRAGVAKGTVYLYFDAKDALLVALRARHLTRFVQAVQPSLSGRTSAVTRLDRFVTGLCTFVAENHRLHHLLFHQAGFPEADAFVAVRLVLERIVVGGAADGAFRVRDPALAAAFVLHGLHGVLIDRLDAAGDGDGDGGAAAALPAARALARQALGVQTSRRHR